jgi:large subunit ribosomal protein L22
MEKSQEATSKALYMPLSFKKSVEVCSFLRGKPVKKALMHLERVAKLTESVPFKRYNKGGLGHKDGYGPARYPVNVCKAMIKLVKDVQANAEQKGLNKDDLVISRIIANKAQKAMHYGRHRGQMKRTHIEIAVSEKKETKKQAPKKEAQK